VTRTVLLVDRDAHCGRILAAVMRRRGDEVHLVRGRGAALRLARQIPFDLAIVDVFVEGGGPELVRELQRWLPEVILSLGTVPGDDDFLDAGARFARRASPRWGALKDPAGASSGGACVARFPGSRPPFPASSVPVPALVLPAGGRSRRFH